MLLYIVRHGDPDYATDSLTELGKKQAEAVAKRLQRSNVNEIYTSPMGRAIQTAEPTCRLLGLDYKIEDWAYELKGEEKTTYPDGELRSISTLPGVLLRENGEMDIPFTKMFDCKALAESNVEKEFYRIKEGGSAFLERLGYREENGIYRILRQNDDRVVLFCHAICSRLWLSELLHIPLHIMWSSFYAHFHTGVTIIDFKNYESGFTTPKCFCYTDTSHLYEAGLSVSHPKNSII